MEEKKFNCKMEDVPVITGFVLSSMETDKTDFFGYSTVFDDQFITTVKSKQTQCNELIKSDDVLKDQKSATVQIENMLNALRVKLNPLEGYLKLAESELSILIGDFGLKNIRTAISKGNVEGVLSNAQSLITNVKKNEEVLKAKGMKAEVLTSVKTLVDEIEKFNKLQNELKNKRSRVTSNNIKDFNELWDMLSIILDAGRALYRGSDAVKLKEYTLANLLKRVHTQSGKNKASAPVETKKSV
jgi:uncharacterized protein (DUF1697 family)